MNKILIIEDSMPITWPKNKPFAVCLTHDVDHVKKSLFHYIYFLLKRKDIKQLAQCISSENDPYWTFLQIMDLEDQYDVRSTLFFLDESANFEIFKYYTYVLHLNKYDVSRANISQTIRSLDERGWEIGLHGSFNSFCKREMLKKEKEKLEGVLGHNIIGIRQHFLNLEIPKSWNYQSQVGFMYDASFGYRHKVGFRDEKFLPFWPFGDSFLEIPTTIMDGALFSSSKDISDAWEKCLELMDLAEARGGLLTLLWHNRSFCKNDFPGWIDIYEKIIVESKNRGAWIAPCRDIYFWLNSQLEPTR